MTIISVFDSISCLYCR